VLEQMADDPYFASGFASAVSPDELAEMVLTWSYRRTPRDQCADDAEWTERNAWYARTVGAVSTTLGTATRATGDLALPAGYGQSWVDAITAEVQSGLFPDGTGVPDHANALGVLLGTGRFSLSFLGAVSEGVYDYERAFQEDYPGAVWAPRSGDPSSGLAAYDVNGVAFRDPMAGIMAALGKDPAAAQNFFAGGDTVTVEIDGQDLQVPDRLAYLVCDRTWAVDPTNGGALGEALVAATTMLRDRTGTGMTSAQIASQTFALIGEKTGEGADGWGILADEGWQMWDGLRPHVAQMLASYGADVFDAKVMDADGGVADGWSRLGSGVLFPDDMPYGATLDLGSVEKIVATLGQNQDDFAIFLAGMFQAGNLAIDSGLQRALVQQPNAGANFLTGGISDDSNPSITNTSIVVGWALDTGFKGDKADEALQKKRMEAIADALSLISGAPFVPEIKPQWLAWGVDQAKDQAIDAVKDSAPTDATATYDNLDQQAREDLTNTVMNLLLRNGYLDQVALDGAAERGFVFEPPAAGAIIYSDSGEALCFDTDSAAYGDWIADSALKTFVAESVVGVYADQWGVVP